LGSPSLPPWDVFEAALAPSLSITRATTGWLATLLGALVGVRCVRRSCRVIWHAWRGRRGGAGVHPPGRPPLELAAGVLAGTPSAGMPCIRPGRTTGAAVDASGEAAVTTGAAAI